jgi:hypothetical protein
LPRHGELEDVIRFLQFETRIMTVAGALGKIAMNGVDFVNLV